MGADYATIWGSLQPSLRTRLAERAHGTIDREDAQVLPGLNGDSQTAHVVHRFDGEESEGFQLSRDFVAWIDTHTTEGQYARGWDVLNPGQRKAISEGENGEVAPELILGLAKTVGVTGAYWPGFQAGPDLWHVGMGFVAYLRERLARG